MIKNSVTINKQKSVEELNQIIAKLTKELAQLKLYIQGLGHAVPKGLDTVVLFPFSSPLFCLTVAKDNELEAQLDSMNLTVKLNSDRDGGGFENTIDMEEHEQQLQALTDAKAQLEEFREMIQAEKSTNAQQLARANGLQEQLLVCSVTSYY
jgi:hypothetical protein